MLHMCEKISVVHKQTQRERKNAFTLISPFLPFSFFTAMSPSTPHPTVRTHTNAQKNAAAKATKIEKPLVFQPIACMKRLPTSALHKRAPLMCSLTFVWHADNRKIAGPDAPPPPPHTHPTHQQLGAAAAMTGMHPASRAIVVCLCRSEAGTDIHVGRPRSHTPIHPHTHTRAHTHTYTPK